jgi:dTDP-4-dehydrorhamnose reductase
MRILVTGRNGQVGYELQRSLQALGEVIAVDRAQMDLADLDSVRETIRAVQPRLIVNSAAYTAVDRAESEPELAMRINGDAPGVMAEEAHRLGAAMIHYSTDYVFDGSKQGPYDEDDVPGPVNVYGRSKLAGERAVQAVGVPHLILRTSWVYGMRGRNFLLTVQRLASERDELRIVADQRGTPTWCRMVADATVHAAIQLVRQDSSISMAKSAEDEIRCDVWQELGGIFHLTAQGQTTWYGFAQAIVAALHEAKKLAAAPKVVPISTRDYPTPAARPSNSVLSCERWMRRFCRLPDWETALKLCLE